VKVVVFNAVGDHYVATGAYGVKENWGGGAFSLPILYISNHLPPKLWVST